MPEIQTPAGADVGIEIEAPLRLDDVEAHDWSDVADLIVVGLGGAGVSAALEATEAGLDVIGVDRYAMGGSSAANGGVYYAGGGTPIQIEAGETDTAEEMYKYLHMEVGGVVSDRTLRRFCDESVANIEWLMSHGAKFNSDVWKKKCSYPPLDRFLYHPDSTLAAPYVNKAKPAARGHRAFTRNGNKAWGLGVGIYGPLLEAALQRGLRYRRYAEAQQIALDASGRVVGVKVLQIPEGSAAAAAFRRNIDLAANWMGKVPPSLPIAGLIYGIGLRFLRKAQRIERKHRVACWLRAKGGVVLSAGGFIINTKMIAHYAPRYSAGLPNGTLGDNGSGHLLGASAGGKLDLMDRISAWRFINPPVSWSRGMLVNQRGERFVNETLYGASLGDAITLGQDGKAWIVIDANLRRQAARDARDPGLVPFQRDIARLNHMFNCKSASSLEGLADKIGFDRAILRATVEEYNKAARGEQPDRFEKFASDMAEIATGPFYALDASVDSRFLPLSTMSIGGLRVDEDTGEVLDERNSVIPGLYAAGRNAVGICSNIYVSGLSYADCIFSGRRAARHIARQREEARTTVNG